MNQLETILAYYRSFETNDRKTLEKILMPTFQFISEYTKYNCREKMLDEIWPIVIKNKNKMNNLEIFRNGDSFIVKYNLHTPDNVSMAEYIVFEKELISKIEVFSKLRLNNED